MFALHLVSQIIATLATTVARIAFGDAMAALAAAAVFAGTQLVTRRSNKDDCVNVGGWQASWLIQQLAARRTEHIERLDASDLNTGFRFEQAPATVFLCAAQHAKVRRSLSVEDAVGAPTSVGAQLDRQATANERLSAVSN